MPGVEGPCGLGKIDPNGDIGAQVLGVRKKLTVDMGSLSELPTVTFEGAWTTRDLSNLERAVTRAHRAHKQTVARFVARLEGLRNGKRSDKSN